MEKNSVRNLIYVFLILQPIIDLFTALMTRLLNVTVTIGVLARGLFLLFIVLYNVFFVRQNHWKKVLVYLVGVFIFMITYFIFKLDIFKMEYFKTEIIYMFKYFYFPIISVCLINCYDYLELKKEQIFKIFIYNVIMMSILIIVPYVTNTSFSSYQVASQGIVGWFYSANEIGAIMVALLPFLYYLLYSRERKSKIFLSFLVVIITMTLLGTKTSFLGMLIAEVLYTLYFLITYKRNNIRNLKISLIIIVVSFGLIPNIPAVKNLQSSIANSNNTVTDNTSGDTEDNESDNIYKDNIKLKRVLKVALSGRDEFFFRTMSIYDNANIEDKIFGIGFVNRESINNPRITKLIEIDPLDVFFHYGIVGFIIYFGPLLYIVFKAIRLVLKNRFRISFFNFTSIYLIGIMTLISMTAGHVYSAPAVSIYVSVIIALLDSNSISKEELKEKNNNKISIYALHLGYGGVEKYISSLCKMLEDNYEIEVISTYKVLDRPAFNFSDKIKITYLIDDKPNKDEFKLALRNKNIIGVIKEGIKAVRLLYLRKERNINSIKNNDSKYIITTRILHNKLVGMYSENDVIKIATEHNYHNNNNKYINDLVNSIKNFDYFVVVSTTLMDFYKEKIGDTKCIYIPNVIDEMPIRSSSLKNNNLINVGRIEKEKDQESLIEVFKLVKEKVSDAKLYIIGDGSLKENLEKKVKEYNLSDSVIFTGFLNKDEIEEYLVNSKLFVLTSLTESFGLVLIEAMSYKVPCIAFDTSSGAKNLLKDGNGILIKDRDNNKMAEGIVKLLNDDNKLKKVSNKGYNSCKRYLLANVKKEWLELLKK